MMALRFINTYERIGLGFFSATFTRIISSMVFTAYLAVFSVLLDRTLASFNQRCGHVFCPDDQVCCSNRNDTCCQSNADSFYSNIAVITRKLSGVLIMLLLFAVGYFFHRILCSRSRQPPSPQNGPPPVTTSQELLMESCTPESLDSLDDPAPRLPSYDECKLPTYEETVRDASQGRAVSTVGQATRGLQLNGL